MTHTLWGAAFALAAAITWAIALVLFKRSGEGIGPVGLNLYKNTVGLVLLGVTLPITAALGLGGVEAVVRLSLYELGVLLLSGVIGIALADTLFFHALNLIGVGLVSIVDCCYSPFAILFAWLMLEEKLTGWHYLGAALVVAGVFTASRHMPPASRTRFQIIGGMLLAALAVGMMAFGIVWATPVLKKMPVVWAAAVRLGAGSLVLAFVALCGAGWRKHWAVFRPSAGWKFALPASVLGTYVCLLFWMAGFKYTYASIAAVLNQTSVIFACVLAALVLKEQFGRRQLAALVLAFVGVVIVTFAPRG